MAPTQSGRAVKTQDKLKVYLPSLAETLRLHKSIQGTGPSSLQLTCRELKSGLRADRSDTTAHTRDQPHEGATLLSP